MYQSSRCLKSEDRAKTLKVIEKWRIEKPEGLVNRVDLKWSLRRPPEAGWGFESQAAQRKETVHWRKETNHHQYGTRNTGAISQGSEKGWSKT